MENNKGLKTPLRYPGGKSRALKFLFDHLPTDFIEEYREPFLGGGSVAIEFSKRYPNKTVWVNDAYYNLYNFWINLQQRNNDLHALILHMKNRASQGSDQKEVDENHRKLFNEAKSEIEGTTDFLRRAAYFYVLNKCSFSGLGESSGFSVQASQSNFSYSNIDKLLLYKDIIKNWIITNLDYKHLCVNVKKDVLIFLDPPYDIDSWLYGKGGDMHANFGHTRFAEIANGLNCYVMITYNSSDEIKSLFDGWNMLDWDLTYTMRSDKTYRASEAARKELLLLNYSTRKTTLEKFFENSQI